MNIKDSHFFFTSSSEIDEIICPLKEFFGLTSLVYQKNFLDGSEIRLSNQPQWTYHFFAEGLYRQSFFEKNTTHFKKSYFLWAGIPQHLPVLKAARAFNIDHGITFIEPAEDGCEFFFIGTRPDRQEVMNYYLNHLDLLELFLIYFREKAAPLIKKADENRIYIPDKMISIIEDPLIGHPDRQSFLKKISGKLRFTNRELDCIDLLVKGYTSKMIAQDLELSYRTVETHLDNIKQKTACSTKAELIRFLNNKKLGAC